MPKRSVLELVGEIYAASTDDKKWAVFLEDLAETLKSATTVLYLQNVRDPKGSVGYAVRTDPELVEQFNNHYSKVTIWGLRGAHLLTEGNVVTGEMVCSSAEVRRSEYSEYLRKLSVFHGYGAVIQRDGALASMLTSLRSERVGPYDEHDVSLLRELMPHLQQAVQIHRRLVQCDLVRAGSVEALERTNLGVVLLDPKQRIVFVNGAAQAIVRSGDGLSIVDGELRALTATATASLRAGIAAVARSRAAGIRVPHGTILVKRPSQNPPYVVMPAPFEIPSELVPGVITQAIAVYIRDPAAPVMLDGEILRALFHLTASEIEIAGLLCSGASVEMIAQQLGITQGTARWHLKRLFAKTGARGQADLVHVILTAAR